MHRSSLQKAFVHLTALGETKVVVVAIYCTGPVHKLNLPNSLLKRQKICFHFLLSFAKWCLQILDVIYYNLVNTPFTPLGVVPGVKGWLLSYRHFCLYHKTNQYVGVKIFKKNDQV